MSDLNSTQNVSIFNDEGTVKAEVTDDAELRTVSQLWDGTDKVTVTNNKLDVNASVSTNVQARVSEPVQVFESANSSRNKAEYTVPTGKVLFVQKFLIGIEEGKMVIGFRVDGNVVWDVGLTEDGTSAFDAAAPDNNPFGPIAAGTDIDIRRVTGDSGKDWSAAWFGYLEDA